jgi:hypothetical protein
MWKIEDEWFGKSARRSSTVASAVVVDLGGKVFWSVTEGGKVIEKGKAHSIDVGMSLADDVLRNV